MNAVNKPQSLASIKFLKGPLTGITFQIDKPVTTIGRDPGNDIVIDEDLNVARHHARLLWNNGSWSIEKHPQADSITINSQNIHKLVLQLGVAAGDPPVQGYCQLLTYAI